MKLAGIGFAFAALALLFSAPAAQAQFASPDAAVKALYDHYTGKDAKGFPHDQKSYRQFFEPGLAKLWTAAKNIEADFFVQGQDFELSGLKIDSPAVSGDKATVAVAFKNMDKNVRLTYDLVKAADGWRIADARAPGQGTLRDMVRKAGKS
jgi:hypothetical protein